MYDRPAAAVPPQRERVRFSPGVLRIINHAANARVSDEQARGRFAGNCRSPDELERAMELFGRWRDIAHGSANG